jgi:3-phenylpropionate/trans-cinnamate dioxygenase ferredoxin reductase subunit
VLVAGEGVAPYARPPLSRHFLSGVVEPADLALRGDNFYTASGIYLVLGDPAIRIDRKNRYVELASSRRLPYHQLVLALGARPRPLRVSGAHLSGVLTLRTLAEARALRSWLARSSRVVVAGAGFIGLEVAAAARGLGCEVTVVESRRNVMARALTGQTSEHVAEVHRRNGVRLLLGHTVTAIHGDSSGRVREVVSSDGGRHAADLVVAGIGVLPETGLASAAGLPLDDGIVVDEYMRTADPSIYAVGDCARYPSIHTGAPARLESVQNAVETGKVAAANLLGHHRPMTAVSRRSVEQYTQRIQIAGVSDGHDAVATIGDPDGDSFSVFCFRRGRLAAVESVNRPDDHALAYRLLAAGQPIRLEDVRSPGFEPRRLLERALQAAA